MGEIKSAIELAMERTKGLRLSEEEKGKLKEEELQGKARALVNRYLEVDFHLREVEKEITRLDPAEAPKVEELFFQYLSEAIGLDRDNDLIFQALESRGEGDRGPLKKMREIIESYRKRKEKEYSGTEKKVLAGLARQGIRGSAVQAKVEGSKEWEEALARFKPDFEKKLAALKKEIGINP